MAVVWGKGFGRSGGGALLVLYHDEAGHITSVIVAEQRDKKVTQALVGGGASGCQHNSTVP